jgi:hypothetical protein
MSKFIKMQKKLAIVLASLLVTVFYRTLGLARPSYRHGEENAHVARVQEGLLFRIPRPWRTPEASARYYAAELNGSFPYVHLQQVSTEALRVPLAFPDSAIEMSDVLGITAFSLNDPQDSGMGMPGNQQQLHPVKPVDDDDDNCGGCESCTACTACTNCTC